MERSENFYSLNSSRPADRRIAKIINRIAEIKKSPRKSRFFSDCEYLRTAYSHWGGVLFCRRKYTVSEKSPGRTTLHARKRGQPPAQGEPNWQSPSCASGGAGPRVSGGDSWAVSGSWGAGADLGG